MLRLLLSLLFVNQSLAGYSDGASFATGVAAKNNNMFESGALDAVPKYQGTDNHGLDDERTIEGRAQSAMKSSEAGQFMAESLGRKAKFDVDESSALMKQSEHVTSNPLASVAKDFDGTVKKTSKADVRIERCEQSGASTLISCKYLLKAVPYYGQRSCSEQHEKAIEHCINNLTLIPQYLIEKCEEPGKGLDRKSVV